LPAIYAKPLGWEGMKVLRSSGSRYVSPGLHINTGILKNLELTEEQQNPVPTIKVAQLLTPESKHSTRYWYAVARNFARNDTSIDEFMLSQQAAAFNEDAFAVESIAKFQQFDSDPDFYEIHIASDKAGIAMRRHLKALADKDSQTGDKLLEQ
jgi:vanillate O-demethylase monooxygenase subunit